VFAVVPAVYLYNFTGTFQEPTFAVRQARLMMTTKKKSFHELTELALRSCMIAKDEAANLRELMATSSPLAYVAIRECEKELDQIERKIDDELPAAISRLGETSARELLASLKFITDLERIGDLLLGVAKRFRHANGIPATTAKKLQTMTSILEGMLGKIHEGFINRDLACAQSVLSTDKQINKICHSLFRRYLTAAGKSASRSSLEVLLAAQALERAGDHATNLAEELHHWIEGHTLRHARKRGAESPAASEDDLL
jgi:phosphate transport system protein